MSVARRSLAHLQPGEDAVIARVNATGRSGQRLLAMGFQRGCRLRFLCYAPLGDPLLIEIPGCVLCLRCGEAHLVELETATA